jgi:hypothetical protein
VALFFYTQDIEVLMQQCQQKNAQNSLSETEGIFERGFVFVVSEYFSRSRELCDVRFADKDDCKLHGSRRERSHKKPP